MYDVLNAYLENGLKVVLHRISGTRTVACGLWVRQGSSYETDENNGLSHLIEHLLVNPENTYNKDYKKMIQKVTSEGVVYNAATTKEYTCFHFTGLTNSLEDSLKCLSNIAKDNRQFPEEFLENEKKVVLQEAMSFYSSFQQIKERTSQAIWGNTGTGKIIMGNMKTVAEATADGIHNLIENSYIPENAVVVVIGNIDYEKTLSLVEKYFVDWQDRFCCRKEEIVESLPGMYLNKGSGSNAVISVGFRGPAYQSKNRIPIEMAVRIAGMSNLDSRMVQAIRVQRGLSYNLGAFSSFYNKRGTIGFMSVCSKDKALEVAKVTMDVLQEIKEKGFKEEEIEREKRIMETAMLLSIENITEHLRNVGRCAMLGRSFFVENEIRQIKNIQKQQLDECMREILDENLMGVAVIGDVNTDKLIDTLNIA